MRSSIGYLIQDLRQRGLLEDTLIIWGGGLGERPCSKVKARPQAVIPHQGLFMWLAGGPIRGGLTLWRNS